MKIDQETKEELKLLLIPLVLIVILGAVLFRLEGIRFFLAMAIVFMLPSYLVLRRCGLEKGETILFSFLAGVGVVPSITYLLGMLIGSITISILIIIVLSIGAAFLMSRIKKK